MHQPYYDLKVEPEFFMESSELNLRNAMNCGYRTLAHNLTIYETDFNNSDDSTGSVALPNIHVPCFRNSKVNEFDLIAFCCSNNDILKKAVEAYNCDLISFDPSDSLQVKSKVWYNFMLEKQMYFEIMYAPCKVDQHKRETILTVANMYRLAGRSRNVIVTSGAKSWLDQFNAQDIFYLGQIHGLSIKKAQNAIHKTAEQLLTTARSRKCFKFCAFTKTYACGDEYSGKSSKDKRVNNTAINNDMDIERG